MLGVEITNGTEIHEWMIKSINHLKRNYYTSYREEVQVALESWTTISDSFTSFCTNFYLKISSRVTQKLQSRIQALYWSGNFPIYPVDTRVGLSYIKKVLIAVSHRCFLKLIISNSTTPRRYSYWFESLKTLLISTL